MSVLVVVMDAAPLLELRRFMPEEVAGLGLSPFTASTLRKKAQRREIHHHRDGEKITFTLEDLRRNAAIGEAGPFVTAERGRPRRSRDR